MLKFTHLGEIEKKVSKLAEPIRSTSLPPSMTNSSENERDSNPENTGVVELLLKVLSDTSEEVRFWVGCF